MLEHPICVFIIIAVQNKAFRTAIFLLLLFITFGD